MSSQKKSISKLKQWKTNLDIQRFDQDNALKCPMCLDTYETPRALACLHTFCEPCLGFYLTDIKASTKDGKLDRIECPICGHFTVPQNLMKHPHAMVKDLPLNHYILPHLDVLTPRGRNCQRNTKITFAQSCGSCSERGITKEATCYCQDCEDFQCKECIDNHSKNKILLNHKIVTIEQVTNSSQLASRLDKFNHCLKHTDEEVRFYCPAHDTLLCSLCVMADHKACELIDEFEELGQKIKDTGEVEKMSENMKNLQKALNDMVDAVRTNNFHIKRETEDIPKRIQTVRAKVLQMFQKLEDSVNKKIEEFQDECGKGNVNKAFKCKQIIAAIEGSNVSLDTAKQHGSNTQLFRTFLKLKAHVQQYDKQVTTEKDSLTCSSINLKIDESLDKIVNDSEQLGEIYIESAKPDLAALPPLLFAHREFNELTTTPELIVSGQIDTNDVNTTKVCIAATYMDKKLALAIEVRKRSWCSHTFSLMNTDTLIEMHVQDMKRGIRDLISIDNNTLAITFPLHDIIQFYQYTPKRKKRPMSFVMDHTVKCEIREAIISKYNKTTFGLSTKNYFATLTHDGVKKQIFYFSVSLRTMESDFWSTQLSVDHLAVDFKKKRIYITCSKPSKLYSFTTKGIVMFEHSLDETVRSLGLDKDGNIHVLSGNHSRGFLRQISPNTGKVLREIQTEAKNPNIVIFNRKGGDFYIISNNREKINLEKYRVNLEDEEELVDDD